MLRAEVVTLNTKGKMSFRNRDLFLYFDDIYAEAEDLIENLVPFESHKDGKKMKYCINFYKINGIGIKVKNYNLMHY